MSDSCPEKRMINSIVLHSQNQPTQDLSAPQSQGVNIIPAQADTDQELVKL